MFGRKAAAKPPMEVWELRRVLTQSHRLMGRLLGSTRSLNEGDFDGIAQGWLLLSGEFSLLERLVPQLVPLAKLQDLAERLDRIKKNKGSGRGASRDAQQA